MDEQRLRLRRRRRALTECERFVTSSRKRRRTSLLKHAFDALRFHVPLFASERRPTRCYTLRLAANYIVAMKSTTITHTADTFTDTL